MEQIELTYQGQPLLFVILLYFFLFLILKGLSIVFPVIVKSEIKVSRFKKFFPAIQLVFWLILLLWTCQYFMKRNFNVLSWVFGIAFLLLLSLISIFYFSDIIAGIIVKLSQDYKKNDRISWNGLHGKIVKFSSRNLVLETEEGEEVYIPFSKIISKKITKLQPSGGLFRRQYIFKLRNTGILHTELVQNIKGFLIQNPHVHFSKEPIVEINTIEKEEAFALKIIIYTLQKSAHIKIREDIQAFLNNYE